MVDEVQESVKVPASADAAAMSLSKLVVACVKNHKAGLGTAGEVSADVSAAVADLGPLVAVVEQLGSDVKGDPLGAAQALMNGVMEAAKSLAGSPGAA